MGKGKYKDKVRSAVRVAVGAAQPSFKQGKQNKHKHSQSPHNNASSSHGSGNTTAAAGGGSAQPSSQSRLSDLQQRFKRKLEGARFRTINERLYTCKGEQAFSEFQSDPSLFDAYHEGYREQVKAWPERPLELIIQWIKDRHRKAVIADVGCGDAMLAKSVPNKVHSFDLVSRDPIVTPCDMAHLPLPDQSVDIVVFCLSLMGTNITDFVREAHRVLKVGGIIKIAEVRSRFEGGEAEGLGAFLKVLKRAGFDIVERRHLSTMFFMVEGVRSSKEDANFDEQFSAKACLYKKR